MLAAYIAAGTPGSPWRNGATYNRLGPAVALAALGEPRRWSEHIAADDSSQASAVAAAAAARVLQKNRDLSAVELRALLALTADVPGAVDGGRGLAAGALDARDRLGHNFKIGHGVVNARAALPGGRRSRLPRAAGDARGARGKRSIARAGAGARPGNSRCGGRRGDATRSPAHTCASPGG